jgi:hypothetical protein
MILKGNPDSKKCCFQNHQIKSKLGLESDMGKLSNEFASWIQILIKHSKWFKLKLKSYDQWKSSKFYHMILQKQPL